MCGFLVDFSSNKENIPNEKVFRSLLELSSFRGPDATEVVEYSNGYFGFNRLSVIGLDKRADQPLQSKSHRYTLCFNGEIYNYRNLAREYKIKTELDSDSLFLLELVDKIGPMEALNVLEGMYAICIFDNTSELFYAGRDRAGIKPFFYGNNDNGMVFSSQFNQIIKHPHFNDSLKLIPEVVKDYFGFGYMQAPNTIYENIFQLKPGEILILNKLGEVKSKINEYDYDYSSFDDKVAQDIIEMGIKKQLISDVGIGAFQSGGIDSTIVNLFTSEYIDLKSYTFKALEESIDESEIAKKYSCILGIENSIIHESEYDYLSLVNEHINHLHEPFGDYSSISTYQVCKSIKGKEKVVLSGDGGDEVFWGYPRFNHVYKNRIWFTIPLVIRRPLAFIARKLGILNSHGPSQFRDIELWVREKQLHIPSNVLDSIFENIDFSNSINTLYTIGNKRLPDFLVTNEFYGHLQRVLRKVDLMSMGCSIEVRVPLLDEMIVQKFLLNRQNQRRGIYRLKDVLKSILESSVLKNKIDSTKRGFSPSLPMMLRGALRKDLVDYTINKKIYGLGPKESKQIRNYVNDFLLNQHNSYWGIWHIYIWQKWAFKETLIK